ncbi:hypothetical protein A0H81_09537 [Grifola frondosa]|uniref:Uncharacterized protein n=1 Tax=Grifola frondosa TaxID=5627 RepID=A0A1C7M7I4_GRIFR|nr:hypothetical protein A0H81_09537 [Grifola frondosa]
MFLRPFLLSNVATSSRACNCSTLVTILKTIGLSQTNTLPRNMSFTALWSTDPTATPAATTTTPTAPAQTSVKSEDIATILEAFARSITQAFTASTAVYQPQQAPRTNQATQDIEAGWIHRNYENKVVLSTGAFVPRTIPGATMRKCILEWHSRNPNQLAKGQLTSNANPPAAQMLLEIAPTAANTTTASYQLATMDRIAALERKILALRRGKETFDGVEVPRHAPPRPPAANPNYHAPTPPPHVSDHIPSATIHEPAAQPSQVPATASSAIAPAAPPNKAPNPTQPVVNSAPANLMPQHPYAQAQDATYAPPHDRNLGAPFKAPKDKEPAYRTMAPVQDPRIAEDVFACSMKSPMLRLTPEELLSISPEV